MKASVPYNFTAPIIDLRNGLASNAMQQWMMSVLDFIGGEYKYFVSSGSAPNFAQTEYTYRLTGGDCSLYVAFVFTPVDNTITEVAINLPIAPVNNFGQFPCYANAVGAPLVPANCAIYSDGRVHISQSGGVAFPAGVEIYVQFSGRYRVQ